MGQHIVVVVVRLGEGGGWVATVTDGADVMVEGRTLARCRAAVRRAVVPGPAGTSTWEERVELPPVLAEMVEEARREREATLAQQRRSVDATHAAIARLASDLAGKLGMRDIARLVGVSHQRVHQVLSASR